MRSDLVKLELQPGINTNDTGLANEGGFAGSNLVRSYLGYAQPIGGWQIRTTQLFEGVARGNASWTTRNNIKCLAWVTNKAFYVSFGGNLRDVTGPLHETVLEDAFTTRNGSDEVTVFLPWHNLREGQEVTFSNHQSTVGGLTIEGTYTVDQIISINRFIITAASNANADVDDGGGNVDFIAHLPEGFVDAVPTGYGTGGYGEGPYGSSADTPELRVSSLAAWGEFLLINPSGYGLWEYQPFRSYLDLSFNGFFDGNADGWALGTGWAYDTDKVTKTAGTGSNLSQNVEDVVEGGKTYRVRFRVTGRTAGTVKFQVNAGFTPAVIDVGAASAEISKDGYYTRIFRAPATPLDFVWAADSAFDGSISEIEYQVEDKAFRITTAPPVIDAMYVNSNGLVCALGTTSAEDGIYDPTLFRCCDLGNNRAWVPDTGSLASFYNIRDIGGKLMGGLATRQQDMVWGDDGVASAQFIGETGDAFAIAKLGAGCGLISRHSMVEQNGFVFWRSQKNFYIFRGVGATNLGIPEVIPCPISRELTNNLNEAEFLKCHMGIVPEFSEFWYFYPDIRDGKECSRVAAFSWIEGHWHTHQLPRSSWCSSGVFEGPIGFGTDGRIFDHEMGTTANGQLLESWIETADLDIKDGGNLLGIYGMVPDFADQTGNVAITFPYKFHPTQPFKQKGPFIVPPVIPNPQGRVNFRLKGRSVRMRFASATTGGFWRMGAHRIDLGPTGARR